MIKLGFSLILFCHDLKLVEKDVAPVLRKLLGFRKDQPFAVLDLLVETCQKIVSAVQ